MLREHDTTFGGDPEGFLEVNGNIVGSERFIPEEGLEYYHTKVVRDGVQVEIQLSPSDDPDGVFHRLHEAFVLIQDRVPSAQFSLQECVEMDPDELSQLSPSARELGCSPSLNVYTGASVIDVPKHFRTRSAGGHIHIGLSAPIYTRGPHGNLMADERRSLVPMLDLVVGNTCVLINRGTAQATRRRVYGKAGEYRLPSHGIEYRTPSNFWLRGKPYVDLIFGLTRFVVDVWHTTLETHEPIDEQLMAHFSVDDVVKAINHNDVELAKKNFEGIMACVEEHGRQFDPLNRHTLPAFVRFVEALDKGAPGLDATNITSRWVAMDRTINRTWSDFLTAY